MGLYYGRAKQGERVRALRSAGEECVFTFYLLDPYNSCGHVTCIVNARSKRKIITCNVTRAAVCDKQEVYFTPPAMDEH